MQMKNKTLPVFLLLCLLGTAACETVYKDPNDLHSFQVTFGDGPNSLGTGTPVAPMQYVSGRSCGTTPCPTGEDCIGFCSLSGAACDLDAECGNLDYCAMRCAAPVYLDIQAMGTDGEPFDPEEYYKKKGDPRAGNDLWVHVKIVPGFVPPPYQYVKLVNGKAMSVKTYVAQAIGQTHLWVEDLGVGPPQEQYGQCNNGVDDDKDGFIDVVDPDCVDSSDPLEFPPTFATGLSTPLYFETPTIKHIQFTEQVASSPLEDQDILVDKGNLVVTNVVANGFFVADLDDAPGMTTFASVEECLQHAPFNGFFLYTFNKPQGVNYSDTICTFSGGVVEYQGNTQMTFPSFDVYRADFLNWGKEAPCLNRDNITGGLEVPEPLDITHCLRPEDPGGAFAADESMDNAIALEGFESSLVKLRNIDLSTRFLACDSDEDDVYPSGSDDDACRDLCQEDPDCTQLESYFEYSQLAAYWNASEPEEGGKKIFVGLDMLKGSAPLEIPFIGAPDNSGNCPSVVDPDTGEVLIENPHKISIGDTLFTEYTCPLKELKSITGTLRHIYLCPQKPGKKEKCGLQITMLIPRFDNDFEFAEGN